MKEANQKSEQNDSKDKIVTPKKRKVHRSTSKLSILSIALTVGLGAFIYYHDHQQALSQKKSIATLEDEITHLKEATKQIQETTIHDTVNQQFSTLKQNIDNQLSEQQKNQTILTNQVNDSVKLNQQGLAHLNERLSAISTTDGNIWLISQANYLVHLAGRKIWNEQDYTTARLLLKSADESLAQANDPSLLPARQAINRDISSLTQIAFIDIDGIVMNLLNLADEVTNLPLISDGKNIKQDKIQYQKSLLDETADKNRSEQDNTTTDAETDQAEKWSWTENLLTNAKSFMEKFIYIEKLDDQDSFSQCVNLANGDDTKIIKCQILKKPITLEQSLYLRENLKFHLLIAAQAVPRHQEAIYQRELNEVSTWIETYFDQKTTNVNTFLTDLDHLKNQSISNQNVPEKLSSSSELEKLMQNHVRSLMTK